MIDGKNVFDQPAKKVLEHTIILKEIQQLNEMIIQHFVC